MLRVCASVPIPPAESPKRRMTRGLFSVADRTKSFWRSSASLDAELYSICDFFFRRLSANISSISFLLHDQKRLLRIQKNAVKRNGIHTRIYLSGFFELIVTGILRVLWSHTIQDTVTPANPSPILSGRMGYLCPRPLVPCLRLLLFPRGL